MSIKTLAAAIALGAVCAVAPTMATAGGELQEYERPMSYQAYSGGGYGAYAAPMPANYARPMGVYGAGYGCPTAPYGYAYGGGACGGGGYSSGMGNDIFTAGLLGLGIGYLLFH